MVHVHQGVPELVPEPRHLQVVRQAGELARAERGQPLEVAGEELVLPDEGLRGADVLVVDHAAEGLVGEAPVFGGVVWVVNCVWAFLHSTSREGRRTYRRPLTRMVMSLSTVTTASRGTARRCRMPSSTRPRSSSSESPSREA